MLLCYFSTLRTENFGDIFDLKRFVYGIYSKRPFAVITRNARDTLLRNVAWRRWPQVTTQLSQIVKSTTPVIQKTGITLFVSLPKTPTTRLWQDSFLRSSLESLLLQSVPGPPNWAQMHAHYWTTPSEPRWHPGKEREHITSTFNLQEGINIQFLFTI